MCGIFGIIAKKDKTVNKDFLWKTLKELALLSESRGKDSSGLAFRNSFENKVEIIKGAVPISELMHSDIVKQKFRANAKRNGEQRYNDIFTAFGHSRLVTNGTQLNDDNNQPVIKDGIVAVHNGIIVNVEELWAKNSKLQRKYEIDTEVMLSILRERMQKGDNPIKGFSKTVNEIYGTVATALIFEDINEFLLGTNNGSLYILTDFKSILFFASEKFILESVLNRFGFLKSDFNLELKQIKANSGVIISLENFNIREFDFLNENISFETHYLDKKYTIELNTIDNEKENISVIIDVEKFANEPTGLLKKNLLEFNVEKINQLKRCKKCVLPETFPFIEFDDEGVCNYCNNYVCKNQPKPLHELQKLVDPYRSKDGSPDCLVPFSGGRDSSYVLHFVKNELKLNPIAFTYDWGMVTDLARRNIARMCGKLGVENIIVAADIKKKRKYIRENILAWLKRPELGMIPLFMAGDKYFFKYANQVIKQNNLQLQIWGINFLENTDFKVGFAGVEPEWKKNMIYSMNLKRQFKLFGFVAKNILLNPSYLNSSVVDTLGSFASRYFNPRKHYYHFFDYHQWNEKDIEKVLLDEYNWEVAKDLNSTWRIGDGTASFYNYIYYTVVGFSEFDTFRSNQIREGMITREDALKSLYKENQPRYESLRWYLEIVGLDYEKVIKTINKIPKLY